jgi:hypothetical protein
MAEKSEGATKNGESRDTANIGLHIYNERSIDYNNFD